MPPSQRCVAFLDDLLNFSTLTTTDSTIDLKLMCDHWEGVPAPEGMSEEAQQAFIEEIQDW
jgi:hypothetical protein